MEGKKTYTVRLDVEVQTEAKEKVKKSRSFSDLSSLINSLLDKWNKEN